MKKILTILLSIFIIMGATVASYAATAADGTYSVSATLTGGKNKARITSATLTVSGGQMNAKVVWSSPYYTWMEIEGVRYNNENNGGNSTFTIPVSALDTPIKVNAETTAMSEPYVIEYTLTLSSSGVTMKDSASSNQSSSASGNAQTSSDAKRQQDNSESDDSQELSEQDTAPEADVITVNNTYSKSTSVSAEMLAGYEGKSMRLSTVRGEIFFDKSATSAIAQSAKGSITLTMEDLTDKDEYKDSDYDLVVDLNLEDEEGNVLYSSGDDGKATVTLNYDKDVEKGKTVKVYRIDGDSKEEIESVYDSEEKSVSFVTEHFSVYAVAQESEGGSNTTVIVIIAAIAVIAASGAAVFVSKKKKMK